MPLFAFLYRTTRPLSPTELAERARVVPQWTLQQRNAGRVVTVSVFGEEAGILRLDASTLSEYTSKLAGCTLVEARDMEDALALAREFPGRDFGTEVEIRPVKTFVAPAGTAA